jgi:hypothetical protein
LIRTTLSLMWVRCRTFTKRYYSRAVFVRLF